MRKLLVTITVFVVLLMSLLLLAPQALSAQENATTQAALRIDARGFPGLDADWQAALDAVIAAEQEHLPAAPPYVLTAFDTYSDAGGDWALAVIAPAAVVENGWEELDLGQLVDILLHRTPEGRNEGHVRTGPAFLSLARSAPRALVDYSPLFASGPSTQQEAEAWRFPWTAGQTWWLGGGWHSGYGANALDFGPLTDEDPATNSAVLAAAGGVLRMACQNDGEQRLLWIEHPNGERTGYLHLDRASVAAAVEARQLLGQQVAQGTFLGTLYRGEAKIDGACPANFPNCTFNTICGYGNAPHIHFILPHREVTVDGVPAATLGSGAAGNRFTSSNVRRDDEPDPQPPDTQPPTALLVQPVSGSLAFTPTQDAVLTVTLAVTDPGGSGVAGVRVQLAWGRADGSWQAGDWVQAAAGPAGEYTAAFAACTPAWRVPHNRPLRVGLDLVDVAGNRTRSDEAQIFRYSFPDLNRDCIVEIKDLLDLLPALLVPAAAQPDYDVNGDGSLDAADAVALLATVLGGPQAVGASAGASVAQTPALFPGLGSRVQFTALPPPAGIVSARDVALLGAAGLVADWRAGALVRIDLSRPRSPALHAALLLGGRVYGVSAAGSLAAASAPQDADPGHLALWELAQPLTPTLVTTLTLGGEVMESALVGDLLYVAAGSAGLHVIDASTLQTRPLLITVDTPGTAADVSVAGNLVYVADGDNGLLIYRSSTITHTAPVTGTGPITPTQPLTPAAPITLSVPITLALLGTWDTPGDAIGVTAVLSTVYVADALGGVLILDASEPAAPRLLATYATASAANSTVLSGTLLYVAAGWQGVLALDVADPAAPYLAGSYDTPGYAHDLAVLGDLLLVADGPGGLQILQVEHQAAPGNFLLIPLVMKSSEP